MEKIQSVSKPKNVNIFVNKHKYANKFYEDKKI